MDSPPHLEDLPSSSSSLLLSDVALSNIDDGTDPNQYNKSLQILSAQSLSSSPQVGSNSPRRDESGLPPRLMQQSSLRSLADPSGLRRRLKQGQTANEADDIQAPRVKEYSEPKLSDVTYGSVGLLSPWFPKLLENDEVTLTWRTRLKRRTVTLWSCFALTSVIFVTNLVLTVVSWLSAGVGNSGVSTIFQGDCITVARLDTGLHLLINILSTLLLSASNLALQLVVSPTRHDVDVAHKKGIWLDIGVPSFRNLRHISHLSVVIWTFLVISSLPIHFLYNSIVFSSLSSSISIYVTVTPSFLNDTSLWGNTTLDGHNTIPKGTLAYKETIDLGWSFNSVALLQNDYAQNRSSYERLENYECMSRSMNMFSWRPNFILVSDDPDWRFGLNATVLNWGLGILPIATAGLCDGTSNIECRNFQKLTPKDFEHWIFANNSISYCLASTTTINKAETETCHLQCAPSIMLVVTIFNAIKCLCILWVVRTKKDGLCTLGDAVASFLRKPDESTKSLGAISKDSIGHSAVCWSNEHTSSFRWNPRDTRWYNAASSRRWAFTYIASSIVLISGLGAALSGLVMLKRRGYSISPSALWNRGFGSVNLGETISWGQSIEGPLALFQNILIANLWQVLVSYLYIAHNSLLSCLLIAEEWTGFARERKALRVSAPVGIQRSTYSISMPLTYGVPIMVFFSVEHWLLSQTTFLTGVIRFEWNNVPWHNTPHTLFIAGYSMIPAVFSLILATLFFVFQAANAFIRKYPASSAMPLVVSCSAAISANCHRPEQDKDAYLLPVRWGVVGVDEDGNKICSFTTMRDVEPPERGNMVKGIETLESKPRRSWKEAFKGVGIRSVFERGRRAQTFPSA